MENQTQYFYPDKKTALTEVRILSRQLQDEYQYGYINGWQQAEGTRDSRFKVAITAAFAVGIVFGHFLPLFL